MAHIPEVFNEWKRLIADELEKSLSKNAAIYGAIHRLGPDSISRLGEFSVIGKMIRGGLVCLGAALEAGGVSGLALQAGAAVELFQSALLVHDDIMDRDTTRRGKASMYIQYANFARDEGIEDSAHVGESLGVCAGDIAFFVAFEILAGLDIDDAVKSRIIALSSRELQYVGVAQMADVYRGALDFSKKYPSTTASGVETDSTLKVYLYKTGRYTFSLPLMIGALIAGSGDWRIEMLEGLGENLGVLFQIKDDEIGLFGSEEQIGKPVGSDIREGKKTIFYTELLSVLDGSDRERLDSIFGNPAADTADIEWVKSRAESSGVCAKVAEYMRMYATEAESYITALDDAHEPTMDILKALHAYNRNRVR